MDPLETWAKGRTLIIGDAAHPMLPHRAGGALSAIEDAEAVGVFLARTDRMSVPAALRRVFCTRASRTREFQEKSRADGLRSRDTLQGARGGDLFEMWMYPGVERWVEEHPEMVLSDDEGKHGYERTRRAAYPARL
jgi:2-polyprenyl-6-methoxyphenol hydroxylase-like FAD-dependent oxidoreductase